MGKLIHFALGALFVSAVAGQTSGNFGSQGATPNAAPAKSPTSSKAASNGLEPLKGTPSRNVGPDQLPSFVAAMSSILLSRTRVTDPFGQFQDPDSRPTPKPITSVDRAPVAAKATPFPDIIAKIPINTIMPGEKSFLIQSRTVKQGGILPILWRGKTLRAQVVSVTSRQIGFKNLETGETAFRTIDLLPVGMTPGNQGITAPGMTPQQPDAPLELEGLNSTP